MKKAYNETDPEKVIFRSTLNSLEIEPSDAFWTQALNNIMDTERTRGKKRLVAWKLATVLLCIAVLLLCLHESLLYHKVNAIEKQVSAIKNEQTAMSAETVKKQEVSTNRLLTKTDVKHNTAPSLTKTVALNPTGNGTLYVATNHNSVVRTFAKQHQQENYKKQEYKSISSASYTKNRLIASPSSLFAYSQPSKRNAEDKRNTTEQPANGNISEPLTSNNTKEIVAKDNVALPVALKKRTVFNGQNNRAYTPLDKNKSADSAATKAQAYINKTFAKTDTMHLRQRFSWSAFFMPGMASDFIKNKYSDDGRYITSKQAIQAREEGQLAFQTGLRMNYTLSKKIKLSLGASYSKCSYRIKQTMLTAEKQDNGTVGCSLVTGSGVVYVPYASGVLQPGDNLTVSGTSGRESICIPLQLSYTLATCGKLSVYAVCGFAANMVINATTALHWQNNYWEQGDVNTHYVEGLNAIHYSYKIGGGVNYAVSKRFSLYAEPTLQGALTAINKNTPLITYPYFLGCALGITGQL